jgi:hypothetical protein
VPQNRDGRYKPDDQTCQQGQAQRVQQHAGIDRELGHAQQIDRRSGQQRVEAPASHRNTERATRDREHETLHEQLPNDGQPSSFEQIELAPQILQVVLRTRSVKGIAVGAVEIDHACNPVGMVRGEKT